MLAVFIATGAVCIIVGLVAGFVVGYKCGYDAAVDRSDVKWFYRLRKLRQLLMRQIHTWERRADLSRSDEAHWLWHDAAKELRNTLLEPNDG